MKCLLKGWRLAPGCAALAISMGLNAAAPAEQHILRVPATLPIPLLSDVAPTDYSEIKVEPGVAGEVELVRERYPDGKVRVERQVTLNNDGNYVNHGQWKMFSPTGDVVAEGQYNFGERNGMWTKWTARKDSNVLNGEPYREFKAPFMSQVTFVNGKMEGDWVVADANDRKISIISFRGGIRNGAATMYLPNGKIMSQTNYENGIPVGDQLEVNKKGELTRAATFENGRKVVTKTSNFPGTAHKKQSEAVYLAAKTVETAPDDFWAVKMAKYGSEGEDMRHGSTKSWYANGKPEMEGAYEYGKKTGTFTFWHENGQVAATGEYKNDVAEGTWVWWHENGQKSAIGKYNNGALIGEWRWWDEGGKLTKQKQYTGTESASVEKAPTEAEPTLVIDISKAPTKSDRR
jgi:antitoxin component YwqK of YwqJK toxin-antitoxin module